MPTWGQILAEAKASAALRGGNPDFDAIRGKYVSALNKNTGRDLIAYYSDWTNGPRPNNSIVLGDMQGFMEVCKDLKGPALDFLIHSPGGSGDAAASIVRYLRQKFSDVRVFVPLAAMSAATMIAFSGNRVVMGKHSQLGPIDPQVPWAGTYVPAGAIREQFEKAVAEIKGDSSVLGAWIPILQQYAPALLVQCQLADELGRRLVIEWLTEYMLHDDPEPATKASAIAEYFGDYRTHGSHGIGITREQARSVGVIVDDLEEDPALQDAVLSVHHAMMISLGHPTKIIENHLGKRYVAQAAQLQIGSVGLMPMQGPPPGFVPVRPAPGPGGGPPPPAQARTPKRPPGR